MKPYLSSGTRFAVAVGVRFGVGGRMSWIAAAVVGAGQTAVGTTQRRHTGTEGAAGFLATFSPRLVMIVGRVPRPGRWTATTTGRMIVSRHRAATTAAHHALFPVRGSAIRSSESVRRLRLRLLLLLLCLLLRMMGWSSGWMKHPSGRCGSINSVGYQIHFVIGRQIGSGVRAWRRHGRRRWRTGGRTGGSYYCRHDIRSSYPQHPDSSSGFLMKPLSLFLPALFSYTNELGKIRNKKTDDRAAVEETGRKPGTNQTNKNENISI